MESLYQTSNTILYCKNWKDTLRFYRLLLSTPGNPVADWFVEFHVNKGARLSIADESRASIKSAGGKGITISLQVQDINDAWRELRHRSLAPGTVTLHPWGARLFYLYDPEGNRIEIWQADVSGGSMPAQ